MSRNKPNQNKRKDTNHNSRYNKPSADGGPGAPPQSGDKSDRGGTNDPGSQDPRKWFEPSDPNWWLVILTPLAVIISVMQWSVARDTMKFSDKAYVGIKEVNIVPTEINEKGATVIDPHGKTRLTSHPILQVIFINGGATPALNVRAQAHFGIARDLAITDNTPISQPTAYVNQLVLMKDSTGEVSDVEPDEINASMVELIGAGKSFLLAWGKIQYRDVFGSDRLTRFCWAYDPTRDRMTPCPNYNKWIKADNMLSPTKILFSARIIIPSGR